MSHSFLLDSLLKTRDKSSLSVACYSPHYELNMDEKVSSNTHIVKWSMLLLKILKLK
jgi:hypothetical protein